MNADQPRTAICPGSYDPVTNGHLDVIGRTSNVFDKVIVGVVNNPVRKEKTLFTAEERKAFIEEATGALDDHFEGWFLGFENPPERPPEGFESVIDLPLDEEWLPAPSAAARIPDQPGQHAQPAEVAPPLVSPPHAPEPSDTGAA